MSLLKNIRRFVIHREPSDNEFVTMVEQTENVRGGIPIQEQELIGYEVRLFTRSIEPTGNTTTAINQRTYSREKATYELRNLVYGDVETQLRTLQREMRTGAVRGSYDISQRIDQIINDLGE